MTSETRDTLLEFPCRFPVKAMGRRSPAFEALVREMICAHARPYPDEPLRTRASKDGHYVSVTVVIEAESQQQLDAIYRALTESDQVLLAL